MIQNKLKTPERHKIHLRDETLEDKRFGVLGHKVLRQGGDFLDQPTFSQGCVHLLGPVPGLLQLTRRTFRLPNPHPSRAGHR